MVSLAIVPLLPDELINSLFLQISATKTGTPGPSIKVRVLSKLLTYGLWLLDDWYGTPRRPSMLPSRELRTNVVGMVREETKNHSSREQRQDTFSKKGNILYC